MMRSTARYRRLLLLAAVVMLTASCGYHPANTVGPGAAGTPAGSAVPAATGSSAAPGGPAGTRTARARPADAVLFGIVQAGPTCPVDPVFHACRLRPLGNLQVQALSRGAGVLARTWTTTDGRYYLHLRPGSYVIVVVTASLFPRCPRRLVSIGSGTTLRTDITCDTGIRLPVPPGVNLP